MNKKDSKYKKALAGYTKNFIKKLLRKMALTDLLTTRSINGTYVEYLVYGSNPRSLDYNLLFDKKARNIREITSELRDDKSVPYYDCLKTLEYLKDGKIKEKDYACVFNVFKNHEFVLNNQKAITEVFSSFSAEVSLYIPFIIEEYPKMSVERRVLKVIMEKSKTTRKREKSDTKE